MKKVALYSSSGRARTHRRPEAPPRPQPDRAAPPAATTPAAPAPAAHASRWRRLRARYERPLLVVAGALFAAALVALHALLAPSAPAITQEDIDAAVLHTLENTQFPSTAAAAYDKIRNSVVRVRGYAHDQQREDGAPPQGAGVGSGVVIVDTGIILTNLHVVVGADRVEVEFEDGLEAEAEVIGVRPEHDLAVLQAKKLPDDLSAATLRSTADLAVGDEVIAVGFPFGIGPSVSYGVVSGLRREYRSPEGQRVLTNLIQFDAAANPGNSGGPLVTADGEVVGIVTGILNPTENRVFIGIGFAVPIENAAAAVGLSPF
jgi:S1-C subfamily serine protease